MIGESPVQGSVRVFVVEAKPLLGDRLAVLSEQYPDLLVVGTASTGQSTLPAAVRVKPDIVLVQSQLPDDEALVICERMQQQLSRLAVILIAEPQSDEALLAAVEAGACGLISPVASDDDLVLAILKAADGEFLLSRRTVQRLFRLGRDLRHGAKSEHGCGCSRLREHDTGDRP